MTKTASKEQENNRRSNGRFLAGRSGNPAGRPRGSRNKVSESLREVFLAAFDVIDGERWLIEFARENPGGSSTRWRG